MSAKSTRSSKSKEEVADSKPKVCRAPAVFKVFYISSNLLQNDASNGLRLERFYHPFKNAKALFITHADKHIMEVMEFAENRRTWLINNNVCSNGRIFMTTPIDPTFFALYYIRKHCANKALELETIHDETDAESVSRLLNKFVSPKSLRSIADVKTLPGDMTFYKYNHAKALAWLALKTKRLADTLRSENIHCGRSALSQNYKRSEKVSEEIVQTVDYLRYACEIVGGYLTLDLHEELIQYLNIPKEVKAEEKDDSKKRKSLTTLKAAKNKKLKTDEDSAEMEPETENESAITKLKNSSLLDDSIELEDTKNVEVSPVSIRAEPLKERVLTTKEKALAKSAKGTKSIASFFKK